MKLKTALTIAGSDCSGGAGIQADIKAMTMNGVYAMSAITALTAQNTLGVRSIEAVTPQFLGDQLDMIFEDIPPDAVKTGMLPSRELVGITAEKLAFYGAKNIVADPVMFASSGAALVQNGDISALAEYLLPMCTLCTPNIPEAEILAEMCISGREDMEYAAKIISGKYGCATLVKGGHSSYNADDVLCENGCITWFEGARSDNPNTHGTGCTLSSAIAANLAKGADIQNAVRLAKEYISGALSAMLDLGKGSGPLDHAYNIRTCTNR